MSSMEWLSIQWSSYLMQVSLPDGLPRMYHSATSITLCPGLEEVVNFGGMIDHESTALAETTLVIFSK